MGELNNFINNTDKVVDNIDNFADGLLNINAQTMGVARQILSKGFQATNADLGNLNNRVNVLEGFRWKIDTYEGTGNSKTNFVETGFTPDIVITSERGHFNTNYGGFALRGTSGEDQDTTIPLDGSTGFIVTDNVNYSGKNYQYLAIKFPVMTQSE